MAATFKQLSKRIPQKPKPSTKKALVAAWKKSGTALSLKRWLRDQKDDMIVLQARDWRFNQKADFHKNQLCSGRTRKRVKRGGSVKNADKSAG